MNERKVKRVYWKLRCTCVLGVITPHATREAALEYRSTCGPCPRRLSRVTVYRKRAR